jgi:hypothetical protein
LGFQKAPYCMYEAEFPNGMSPSHPTGLPGSLGTGK